MHNRRLVLYLYLSHQSFKKENTFLNNLEAEQYVNEISLSYGHYRNFHFICKEITMSNRFDLHFPAWIGLESVENFSSLMWTYPWFGFLLPALIW